MARYRIAVAKLVRALAALAAVSFLASHALAGTESYTYDALGRLIQWVDPQGRVTQYTYDAVGNILSVGVVAAQQNPTVTSVTPQSVRRGQTAQVTIAGTNLANVTVTPSDPGMALSGLVTTATQVTLSLTVADTVPLGAATLTLSSGQASAAANLTILARVPTLSVAPAPIAIPPDNAARTFTLSLSNADAVANVVNLSVDAPAVAAVAPAAITFAAGQTSAVFQVTGKTAGQAVLTLSSPTLATAAVPIFVTAEFQGINSTFAPTVGLQVGAADAGTGFDAQLASTPIGVTVGTVVTGLTPDRVQIGGTTSIVVSGNGIPAGSTAAITPSDGVTLGSVTVAADGSQATVPVTVAAAAPTTVRRLALSSAGGPLALSRPDADQLRIVGPTPQVVSISPNIATPGTTIATFTVFGHNLTGATAVQFLGGDVVAGSSPVASADGTTLTTSVTVALNAQVGPRVVVVLTPSGSSDASASPANTFNVVNQAIATFSPVASPLVGLFVGEADTPPPITTSLASMPVGVVAGPAITSVAPGKGARGQTVTLTLGGQGLVAPASVTLTPGTGVAVGPATVAAAGDAITVTLTIAVDATLGARALAVTSGAASVPFASASLAQFLVTAPVPQVQSLDPNTVVAGAAPATLTVRGVNFQSAQQVRVSPTDGVTIGTPTSNAAGDTITATMSAASNAPAGPRVVTVVTPGGESDATPSAANTLNVITGTALTVSPLLSGLVGVQVGDAGTGATLDALVASSLVGLQVGDATPPATSAIDLASSAVGIVLGPFATGVSPGALVRGAATTLVVTGAGLPSDAVIGTNPATGLTIGATVVAPDGTSANAPVTVAADAPLGLRGVTLTRPATPPAAIAFVPPATASVVVSPGAPSIVSLTPILARQGDTVTVTIRGTNFNDFVGVTIEPPDGVTFDATGVLVSVDRTIIDVRMRIDAAAATGGRVVRVTTLAGQSSNVAAPANTFTIFPP